jgi:tetratricopeptide (TPR) repeat protein
MRALVRTSILMVAVSGWAASGATAENRPLEPGDYVMPKEECVIQKDGREVPLKGRIMPFVVQSIAGGDVDLGCGRTAASSLVRLEDADAYYGEWIKRSPQSVDVRHLRSMVYVARRDYPAALADLDAAIALMPGIPRLYTKRAHVQLLNRDRRTKKLIDPERIRADCEEALRLNRNELWAYCCRLQLQAALDPKKGWNSQEDFQRIQFLVPPDAETCEVRGMLYKAIGLTVQAIRDLDMAIDLEPYCGRFHAARGGAYNQRGKLAEARRDFETAIRLDPKGTAGYTGRIGLYVRTNEIKQAVADADKAVELAPHDLSVLTAVARMLCSFRDPAFRDGQKAMKLASEAYRIDPNDFESLQVMGIAYAEIGDFAKAEEFLRKAFEQKNQMSEETAAYTAHFINRVRSGLYPEHD